MSQTDNSRRPETSWGWRDALASLLAGAALFGAIMFLYWNLVVLLPDEALLRSNDPLGTMAAMRLALFLPLALLVALPVAYGYKRIAMHPGFANLLPGAAFAASIFVLTETRWIQSPFPDWFLFMRAGVLFAALPVAWWLLARKWQRVA